MTFEDKLDRVDGIFALDTGCESSGIKDDDFKEWLKDRNNRVEVKKLLTELAKGYMSKDYTIEDMVELVKWTELELNIEW